MGSSNTGIRPKRRQLFVEPSLQGALLCRAALYWVCGLGSVMGVFVISRTVATVFNYSFDSVWFSIWPAAIATAFLLPLVIYDMVRLSNRFTGPMLRLRRGMRQLAAGEKVAPMKFRDGDYWQEFAGIFNEIAERMQAQQTSQPSEKSDDQAKNSDDHADLQVVSAS